jgi:hypothetical protein
MNGKTLICVVLFMVAVSGLGCISKPNSSQPNGTHDKNTDDIKDIKDIKGIWLGSLKVPGGELRILFNISTNPDWN